MSDLVCGRFSENFAHILYKKKFILKADLTKAPQLAARQMRFKMKIRYNWQAQPEKEPNTARHKIRLL
jgi:hypothetical protein